MANPPLQTPAGMARIEQCLAEKLGVRCNQPASHYGDHHAQGPDWHLQWDGEAEAQEADHQEAAFVARHRDYLARLRGE
jgi:hypothetical protein